MSTRMLYANDRKCVGVTSGVTGKSYNADRSGFLHVDDRDVHSLLKSGDVIMAGGMPPRVQLLCVRMRLGGCNKFLPTLSPHRFGTCPKVKLDSLLLPDKKDGTRLTKLAAWSSDWVMQPIPDETKSVLTGRQEFVQGKKLGTYGGTFYYRLAMPAFELAKHGYEVILSYQLDSAPDGHIRVMDAMTGEWHDDCEIVWTQRHMGENAADMFSRAIATGQQVLSDLDDQFWNLPKSNVARDTTDPITHPHFNRDHYRKAIAASSGITVSTPALAKEVERLGPPVFLCRNMIDIQRWPQLDPGSEGMVGWIGGIAWRANDMQVLRQFLPEFLEDYELPWYHGGDSQEPNVAKSWDLIGIDPRVTKCTSTPICHIKDYPQIWRPLNISLIPLEDVKFNHCKSTLKQLESSACGLPYIVSDLPEQRWFANHGGMGRLAKNWKPKTWENHLTDLLDPEVRRIEGAANRKHAEQFDIRQTYEQWDNVFRELGADPVSVAA